MTKKNLIKWLLKNSPDEFLQSNGFFNIYRTLKEGGVCEIIVYQPIFVMQDLNAGEIEANCKLVRFNDILIQSYSFIEIVMDIKTNLNS